MTFLIAHEIFNVDISELHSYSYALNVTFSIDLLEKNLSCTAFIISIKRKILLSYEQAYRNRILTDASLRHQLIFSLTICTGIHTMLRNPNVSLWHLLACSTFADHDVRFVPFGKWHH